MNKKEFIMHCKKFDVTQIQWMKRDVYFLFKRLKKRKIGYSEKRDGNYNLTDQHFYF